VRDQDRGKRLIAVCLLGLVLINFPGHRWFGLPPLFLYLFGAWAGLIVLLALIVERRPTR
jgi:hypothetical protein